MRWNRSGAALVAAALVAVSGCAGVDNARHAGPIEQLLEQQADWVDDAPRGERLWDAQRDFYDARAHLPAWIDGLGATPQVDDLLHELRDAGRHGLDPAAYGLDTFEDMLAEARTRLGGTRFADEQVPELDVRLTGAYLRYAADLLGWNTIARQIDRNWVSAPDEDDLAARLEQAIAEGAVGDSLRALAPSHSQYRGLQAALAAESGDGERAGRLRMNLERWRWMPRDLGERFVLVNVPAYELHVMERDRSVLTMRTIVGSPDTPTPVFSDRMSYLVFSPYWNIPDSILREETLPRIAKDPEYLSRNQIEIVRGEETVDPDDVEWDDEEGLEGLRFRQAPGPENALGLVKFIFPNNFHVYLHDTPDPSLFAREERTFSHGCVRVEQPVELAEYVLRDQPDWTDRTIRAAMGTDQEQIVRLTEPLPVHIGYWTAWVEPDGSTVAYLDDPYGFDAKHARARAARIVAGE